MVAAVAAAGIVRLVARAGRRHPLEWKHEKEGRGEAEVEVEEKEAERERGKGTERERAECNYQKRLLDLAKKHDEAGEVEKLQRYLWDGLS